MNFDEIDAFCRALPGCAFRYPFESSPDLHAWCIDRKMFAWTVLGTTPIIIQAKADPELVPMLVANHTWISPGYHMNKRHWVSINASAGDPIHVLELLEDAHAALVRTLPRAMRLRLLPD